MSNKSSVILIKMSKAIPFKTNYKFGMSEKKCWEGNIVNDAYKSLPWVEYREWEQENWEKFSNYEKQVAENIQMSILEGNW